MLFLLIVLLISSTSAVICSVRLKTIEESLLANHIFNNEDIVSLLNKERITFRFGSYYAYSSLQKRIVIKQKENYSYFDFFAICHEVGHLQDKECKSFIVFTYLTILVRLILFPICFAISIVNLFRIAIITPVYIVSFTCALQALHIILLIYCERRASLFALNSTKKLFGIEKSKTFKYESVYSLLMQLSLEITLVVFIVLINTY